MTKKEYLLKLLEKIPSEAFPIQKDIIYLIDHNAINDSLIDTFYDMFQNIAKIAKTNKDKQIIEKGLIFIKKIKELESNERIQDQKDIDILDSILDGM